MGRAGLFYVVAERGRGGVMHIYRDAAPKMVTPSATTLCAKYMNVRPADNHELVEARVCGDCSKVLGRADKRAG